MPRAPLNGYDFYYEVHGKGEPLLLIAGYSCRTTHWSEVLNELSEGYEVILFDNRGVGQT